MKSRGYIMLGLALLLAGAAVFLARNWVQSQVQPVAAVQDPQPQVEMTKVVVAATQLHFGNSIRREHLRVVDWPVSAVPEGSFETVETILDATATEKKAAVDAGLSAEDAEPEDRVVLRSIEVNEPILKSKITGFGGRASLSTLIAPGMRASTIRVNDVNGVAGFVLPGDRVDILLTRDPNNSGRGGKDLQTDIFLQNMKVLAIDQDANEDRSKPAVVRAVTLEVTPVQAQKLTLAQRLGSLSLALRNVNTVDAEAPQSVSARDLRVGEVNQAPGAGDGADRMTVVDRPVVAAKPEPRDTVVEEIGEAKKAVVTKTVSKKTKNDLSTVKIVRGLSATEYEVTPEKPTFSAPAYSKPLNLLPSKLAPAGDRVAPTAANMPLAPSPLAPTMNKMAPPTNKMAPMGQEPAEPQSDDGGAGKTALDEQTSGEPVSLLKGGSRIGDDG